MIEKPIPQEQLDYVRNMVHDTLRLHFTPEDFTFDPIVLEHEIDYEGDELLLIKIIFDGDQSKLDSHWTMRLPGQVHRAMLKLGMTAYPITSFIEKSEWEDPYYQVPDYLREDVEE